MLHIVHSGQAFAPHDVAGVDDGITEFISGHGGKITVVNKRSMAQESSALQVIGMDAYGSQFQTSLAIKPQG